LKSIDPTLKPEEIRQIVRTSADDIGAYGHDGIFGFGVINASASATMPKPLAPVITYPTNGGVVSGESLAVKGSANGQDFGSYKLEYGEGRYPGNWIELANSTNQVSNGVLGTIDLSALDDGEYGLKLTAYDLAHNEYTFNIYDVSVDNFEAKVSFPTALVSKGTIEVYGTAESNLSFSHYSLEWGEGSNPSSWSTQGITLVNNGNQETVLGKLGEWETSSLNPVSTYSLKIIVSSTVGTSVEQIQEVTIDDELVPSWPKMMIRPMDGHDDVAPVIDDLDGDGQNEIIIYEGHRNLQVYRRDGTIFPGFPVEVVDEGDVFGVGWSVIVDDLDGDGDKEISGTAGFKVFVLEHDGSYRPGFPKMVFNNAGSYAKDRGPVVADLNRDGVKELVGILVNGGSTGQLYALNLNGVMMSGYPVNLTFAHPPSYPYYSMVSVADMNGDDEVEIAFGYGRDMHLYDKRGQLLPGWPHTTALSNAIDHGIAGRENLFTYGQAFADINGDGVLELFALGDWSCLGCDVELYGFNFDGSAVSGFPYLAGAPSNTTTTFNTPTVADVDSDGKDEVFVGLDGVSGYDDQGQFFTNTLVHYSLNWSPAYAPSLVDINGDDVVEGLSVNGSVLYFVDMNIGFPWQRQFPNDNRWFASPGMLADMDGNGKLELALYRTPVFMLDEFASLYVWEMPFSYGSVFNRWSQMGHDASRTGNERLGVSLGSHPSPTPTMIPTPTIALDTQPPTVPLNLVSTQVTDSQVDISWDESTDDRGGVSYEVYRDGEIISTIAQTTYGDGTVTQNTTYEYYVVAVDDAGNASGPSNTISVTTTALPAQQTLLKGTVTSGNDGSLIAGVDISVKVSSVKGKKAQVGTATTNSSGEYAISLDSGVYDLSASATGYKSQSSSGVTILGGEEKIVDFILEIESTKGGGHGKN
jgi:chitodextrinase